MIGEAMSVFAKLKQSYCKLLIVGTVCGLAVFAAGVHADDKKQMVVFIKWEGKRDAIPAEAPKK
jgi:hypothetical protein